MIVYVKHPTWPDGSWMKYLIGHNDEGEPVWKQTFPMDYKGRVPVFPDGAIKVVIPQCGNLCLYNVTPEDSVIITGMSYPASMDRLMEMIFDYEQTH